MILCFPLRLVFHRSYLVPLRRGVEVFGRRQPRLEYSPFIEGNGKVICLVHGRGWSNLFGFRSPVRRYRCIFVSNSRGWPLHQVVLPWSDPRALSLVIHQNEAIAFRVLQPTFSKLQSEQLRGPDRLTGSAAVPGLPLATQRMTNVIIHSIVRDPGIAVRNVPAVRQT